MPVEPREAGRWKRERQSTGTNTVDSARKGSTRRRDTCPMGMGRTCSLDRAHVGNPGNGIEGGKWFRLIDKVWSPKSLGRSLEKVVAKGGSAGIDNQSARQIERHKDQTIANLEQESEPANTSPKRSSGNGYQSRGVRKSARYGVPSYCGTKNSARSPAPSNRADL